MDRYKVSAHYRRSLSIKKTIANTVYRVWFDCPRCNSCVGHTQVIYSWTRNRSVTQVLYLRICRCQNQRWDLYLSSRTTKGGLHQEKINIHQGSLKEGGFNVEIDCSGPCAYAWWGLCGCSKHLESLAFWWVCCGCGRWNQVVKVTKHSGMLFKRGEMNN